MKLIIKLIFLLSLLGTHRGFADVPDWSENARVPLNGRPNIFEWSGPIFLEKITAGKIHAQIYPVNITGALPPYYPVKTFLEQSHSNPLRELLRSLGKMLSGFKTFDDVLKSLGLHPYPQASDEGIYNFPKPDVDQIENRVGFGLVERDGAVGFTFSCAACHSSNLFGKTVLGLTNRFSRANDFFHQVKGITPFVNDWIFQYSTKATDQEMKLLRSSLDNLKQVNVKKPIALGLDTSLAQVALSLNMRNSDPWATPSQYYQKHPRKDPFLDDYPADSKPAVWWNLKYKNKWLSDGSVRSGNPIVTNILWNEIGRGTDLKVLGDWIDHNLDQINEITTAVFSIEAPRITDFFDESHIQLQSAIRGEVIFNQNCAKCHGYYDKNWSLPEASSMSVTDVIKTYQVRYKENTPVVDVGTDPYRYLGMKSLEVLNQLEISKKYGVKVQAQKGYVPPPLVGIWARWPYFHNNSIPNLCALLTPTDQRPAKYYAGAANNKKTDFDYECNGYPVGKKTPQAWRKDVLLFDSKKVGLGNQGHDNKIFIKDGKEILSEQNKKDLIQFLQTL